MIFLSAILWESLREVTFGSERQAKEKGEQKTENRKQSQEIKRDSSHKKRAMEKSSSLRGLCSEWCGAGFVMEEQIAPRETQTREGFSRSADVGSGGSGWRWFSWRTASEGGPYTKNPRAGRVPALQGREKTQDPPSKNEDGAPGMRGRRNDEFASVLKKKR